ncbi:MAG: ATP-binding cassette domain-containing protein [Pirellulales bacterium]|nr:ATP-binding cassette domain-containing protein [Pirellulales bacterium]
MIQFERVSKMFPGGTLAVDNLTLDVHAGETLVLLGTSGSGKTTSMKMVNRLTEPTAGHVRVDGRDVMRQDPIALRRTIGYAIQHIGLFTHMTVAENIAVVPRLLRWPQPRIDERIDELLIMVGLDPRQFQPRYPAQLSGGQRQRVGVARALAADPPIVLMDEPFGALDPITREQLQDEFLALEGEIRKTIVFVTHDVFEAVKMGDRIALLDAGRLQQLDAPRDLVERPANEFVEAFLGHHRVQLELMTRKVGALVKAGDIGSETTTAAASLHDNDSLLTALGKMKSTRADRLSVFRREQHVGTLSRRQLLAAIAESLGLSESSP